MINIKQIKASILSFAFRGELVDFPDKTKENLELEKIHNANKKYVSVKEEEQLIIAPEHWNWTRLGYITSNHGQATPLETFCYIDVGTMDNIYQKLSKTENIVEAKDAPSRAKKIVKYGDVLYSTVRPYLHNVCIVDKEFSKKPIASTAFCVMKVNENVLTDRFLLYWLISTEFDKFSNGNPSKGTLYPAIGEKDLLNGVIPLPSIKEQQEIIEKISEAFNAIESLDFAQTSYFADLEVLKRKIIDAGIQGKLTKQLPEDGTAEDLYTEIQVKKNKLIQEGKIKKEKALPVITEDEIPFDIPPNWKWVRLGEISLLQGGYAFKSNLYVEDSNNQVIRLGNVKQNELLLDARPVFISDELADDVEDFRIKENDILITMTGTRRKKDYFYAKWMEQSDLQGKKLYLNQRVGCIKVIGGVFPPFLVKALQNTIIRKIIFERETGAVNQGNLGSEEIKRFVYIPLPPYAEQIRIVEKIDEIFANMK